MLSRHVLTVSDFQVLIKSCSIASRNDPSPKSEVVHETKFSLKISYSTHACLAQLDQYQTCKLVMVSVLSSNPTGGNFIFLRPLNANFVQNDRNVRFVLFTKTSSVSFSVCDDGQQRGKNGHCAVCLTGTYRTKGIHDFCVSCPKGWTTAGNGTASFAECMGTMISAIGESILTFSMNIL